MKKILLTLLAVLTLSSISAQNKGTNQMRVLWCEIESSNTAAQITGTDLGNTYAGHTYGDWTHNNTVPFPMADDHNALNTCAGLYEGTVPTVFFIAPNGYYRSIYGEADGISHFDTAICNSHMVDLMNNYPRSGQAPVISDINIPGSAAANANVSFSVEYISVDAATVEWTFQNGTPATASTPNATCTWSTPGTYNVTVTVTNANGSATETGTISILNYVALFDFENTADYANWTFIDADGDGNQWTLDYLRGQGAGHEGSNGMLASASWTSSAGALTPNNWVFTDAITLPNETGLTLSWWDKGQDPDYAAEHYAVYICTEATVASATATTPVWEGNSIGSWRNLTASLDAYAGQTIYIAFRHYNVSDMFMLDIDDIAIGNSSAAKGINTPKDGAKAKWAQIGSPFTTYDFRDTQHQYPIQLQKWLDSGYCVVIDYSCTWCGPCWNLHQAGILDGFFYRFGPNFSYPFVGLDNAEEINLSVYPNPTTGIVTVDGEGIKNVEVMDMSGRMVMNTNNRTVDMTNLSNGIYMMRISTEKGTFTQKIVKK
ncbi:MAG: choice-of-anchor J domain-containing protein [Bacteroidales bacterium]|nr:choice-of-anchor J domain-containing protein [Bacteroidales bacterium]